MAYSTMSFQDEFGKFWTRMVPWVRDNWDTLKDQSENDPSFSLPYGTYDRLSVEFGVDRGDEFIELGFMLPDDCFVVIDDGITGELNAIRIFQED